MALLVIPSNPAARPSPFIQRKFTDFPTIALTKTGWLIGSYDSLRSFIGRMKEEPAVRDRFMMELREAQNSLQTLPGDQTKVLLRFGCREPDKVYDTNTDSLNGIGGRTGSANAPKIHDRISSDAQRNALAGNTQNFAKDRKEGAASSSFDNKMSGRVTDIDASGDYKAHWAGRQFEAHHIVEDSFSVMREAKSKISGLTRGSAPCVLLCAELHQRFFTSALSRNRHVIGATNLSERDLLNAEKTKSAFEHTYDQLYSRTDFADIKTLSRIIIDNLFAS